MTAIIVTQAALPAAEAVAGMQWSVPLSASGGEPATHMGCNWVNAPQGVLDALAQIDGVSMGEDFLALCASLGLSLIVSGEV